MAGVALHEGKIAEQRTGEGKTLSATPPLYLNALLGQGAHLVTVNDYLARRDCGWMGAVFHFLGLKTAAIIADKSFIYDPEYVDNEAQDWRLIHLREISRKEAYQADITYGINSEFGFDYLRDNMASDSNQTTQRGFYYAIIDEADSVLIDEARTPHIISAPYDEDTSKYYHYAKIVKSLTDKEDFVIDEKMRTANLTEKGILKIESMLGVKNIYEKDFDTLFHIEASLKALALFKNNKEYIVKDNEIVIVDEFTGRLLYGRRFSEGIHQAIEAKENVTIQKESKTLATVSLQNYFRMYKKLAGMTGTASTESEEFSKIYKTDVIVLPTHRPMVRKDHPDLIYKTESGKFNAVAEEIISNYKIGRPVLVGTTSIEKNELLSQILNRKGIPHELLNAKNHEKEAQIIARAGEKGAITVATNMAGRGVDVILGGQPPNEFESTDSEKLKTEKNAWQAKHDEVIKLGGLLVVGTERHESRRIDNQLRGRSGRQGDPGETKFFVALEDDLMRIFGGEQISNLMTFFNFPADQALTHPMVSRAIEQAQVKVEGFNFDIRKHLVDFDDVLNKQREIVYTLRRKILHLPKKNKKDFILTVTNVLNEEVDILVNQFFGLGEDQFADDTVDKFTQELNFIFSIDKKKITIFTEKKDLIGMAEFLKKELVNLYRLREQKLGTELWTEIVKTIILSTIDKYWTDHLTAIEDLREGINLRGYAQLDPLVEYKNEAFSMFEKLIGEINFETARRLFKVEVETNTPQEKDQSLVYQSASAIDPFTKQEQQATQSQAKPSANIGNPDLGIRVIKPGENSNKHNLGRNDPCWCGAVDPKTGKPIKYKKCHYPN